MLLIRAEQLQTFQKDARCRYAARLAAKIREELPGICVLLSSAQLQKMMERTVEMAAENSVREHLDILHLARLILVGGIDPGAAADIAFLRSILDNPSLSPSQKLDAIARAI